MVEGSGFENRRARKGSRGSNPFSSVRSCGSCGSELRGVNHPAESGRTWVWACACGWASARTEASANETQAGTAIARALEKLNETETE